MKRIAIIAVALTTVLVGTAYALQPATQTFPPLRRLAQVHSLCDTLSVSPGTPIPDVGEEGVIRLDCPGSSSDPLCNTWSQGLDCAFYVGNSRGGGGGNIVPTFLLPPGYVHIWVKGSATGHGLTEAQDCSAFDDADHWLASGTPVFLGNIAHSYCAHLDADAGNINSFDVIWYR